MNDLTHEKWQELAAKLDGELADTQAQESRAASTAGKLLIAALLLLGICIALQFVFYAQPYAQLAAMLPGLLFLIAAVYTWRYRRIAEQARNDSDRIQRDIRHWKKKKPADAPVAGAEPDA